MHQIVNPFSVRKKMYSYTSLIYESSSQHCSDVLLLKGHVSNIHSHCSLTIANNKLFMNEPLLVQHQKWQVRVIILKFVKYRMVAVNFLEELRSTATRPRKNVRGMRMDKKRRTTYKEGM